MGDSAFETESYEFREGENGGLMCSGEEQRDLLAIKPTIVGTTNDAPTERITALLTACRNRLRSNGLIVVSAVTLESFRALLSWAPDHRAGLCRIDIANECLLAKRSHHFAPQNTIYVFTFHKEAIS